jgi:hypothetical protein
MSNNKFIEDCLTELTNNEKARENYNSFLEKNLTGFRMQYSFFTNYWENKTVYILPLLSRTPENKAIMPFLDVKLKNIPLNDYLSISYNLEVKNTITPQQHTIEVDKIHPIYNLDHLLYREFTEALRTGKGFEEALKTINKIYLQYVSNN